MWKEILWERRIPVLLVPTVRCCQQGIKLMHLLEGVMLQFVVLIVYYLENLKRKFVYFYFEDFFFLIHKFLVLSSKI